MRQPKNIIEAKVVETLPNTTFKLELADGSIMIAHLSGKMRLNYIKVMLGDRVLVEPSPDSTRGRIVRRL